MIYKIIYILYDLKRQILLGLWHQSAVNFAALILLGFCYQSADKLCRADPARFLPSICCQLYQQALLSFWRQSAVQLCEQILLHFCWHTGNIIWYISSYTQSAVFLPSKSVAGIWRKSVLADLVIWVIIRKKIWMNPFQWIRQSLAHRTFSSWHNSNT